MNLDNTHTIEDTTGGFYIVTAVSTVGLIVLFVSMWVVLRNNGTFPKRMFLLEEDAVKLR